MLSITGCNSYRGARQIFCVQRIHTGGPHSFKAKRLSKWQIPFVHVLYQRRWVMCTTKYCQLIMSASNISDSFGFSFDWVTLTNLVRLFFLLSIGVYGTLADFLYRKLVGSTKIPPPLTLKPATDDMVPCTIWGPTCDAIDSVIRNLMFFFLSCEKEQMERCVTRIVLKRKKYWE